MSAHFTPLSGDQHWATFSTLVDFANEADVEHRLVMPLLEALGFERADTASKVPVTFTRGTKKGRPFEADFVAYSGALHDRDTSLMIVEVKAPGKPLEDAREQAESYAFQLRAPVLFVTNGRSLQVWQLQVSQESTLVLEINVAELLARRADVERLISKQALLHHCESLAFKKLTPAADFSAYETAELTRAQEVSIPRRLKTAQREEVSSTALLESFPAGALVIAPSGYGKTVLSRQLITAAIKHRWTNPNAPVVADIPLIDFAQSEDDLVMFFFRRVAAQQPEVTLASVQKAVRDQGAVMVCDGLEYVSQDLRVSVDSRLRLFRRDFPKGQLFVFSRSAAPASLNLPRLTLERFNGKERQGLAVAVTGKDFPLWNMPRLLWELSEVPLLLRLILDIVVARDTFPNRLEELFEHWLTQLRDGLAGTPAAKARFDLALTSIAREIAQRRLSSSDALAVVMAAGLGSESFDDLINSGAVVLTESSIGIVHDALGDYLRARALAALRFDQFEEALAEMQIQDDSLLPVLLVLMTQNRASRQLVWKRLESLSLQRYIDTIRFGQSTDQPLKTQQQDGVAIFLTEMVEGIEAMLRGFFPDVASIVRASVAQTPFPVDAITLRGDISSIGLPQFTYTIFPSASGISGIERAMPLHEHGYKSMSLNWTPLGSGDGRYMAACVVRDAFKEVIDMRTFRGGTLLANERALGRLRKLHGEYGWSLTPDDSLSELLQRLQPHSDKIVSQSSWRRELAFTIQSVIEDLELLVRFGREKLDWWWLSFGSSELEIFAEPERAKAYLRAHYSRVTGLYAEIVRTSFGRVASTFPFFKAMPFRWEILIHDKAHPPGHHGINWQWMPVDSEAEAEPLCLFEHEAPAGLFDAASSESRLRSELARLDRLSERYTIGGGGGVPAPDTPSLTRQDTTETSAMTEVAKMLADDISSLFADLPSRA